MIAEAMITHHPLVLLPWLNPCAADVELGSTDS